MTRITDMSVIQFLFVFVWSAFFNFVFFQFTVYLRRPTHERVITFQNQKELEKKMVKHRKTKVEIYQTEGTKEKQNLVYNLDQSSTFPSTV